MGSAVAGNGGTINLPTGNISSTTTYNVLATNATTGCNKQMTGTVTITIASVQSVTAGGPDNTCSSASPTPITLSGASFGGSATSAAWSILSGGGTLSSTSQTASPATVTYTPAANSTGTVTLSLTSAGACGSAASANRTINIGSLPTALVTNGAQTICSGSAFTTMTFSTSPTISGTTFSWTRDNTTAVTGIASSGTGSSITGVALTNTTSAPVTVTFTITPTGPTPTFCDGDPITATIIVNPKPVGSASAQSICTGGTTSVALNSTVTGTTFTWTAAVQSGTITGASNCSSSCGNTIAQTLVSTAGGVEKYTITPVANGCTGTAFTANVTINALPANKTVGGTTTICAGSSTNITVASSATGVNYQLRNNADNSLVGSAVAGTGGTINLSTGALSTTTTFNVLATTASTGCSAQMATTITITVNVAATADAGGPDATCQATPSTPITLSGASVGGSATTGAWSITSGGGSLSSTAQTASPASVIYTPSAGFTGTVTLKLTTNDPSGICGAVTDTRTINVNPLASVTPGGPTSTCISFPATPITLSGASVGGGANTGAWSITSGTGTLSTTAQTSTPATVTYTPVAGDTGTVILTLTTNATGACPATSGTRTIILNPLPAPTITSNYCLGSTGFTLTSSSASTYVWNTGKTTQSITDSVASIYTVTVTNSFGCSASVSADIGGELVVNGNFSSGNTGFTSVYTNNQSSIFTEGTYAVTANANTQHSLFYGNDHDNPPSGLFMAVNGAPTTIPVWQETVNVVPNTTYYFSAFVMSMNQVPPYAQLQFSINGTLQGSAVQLPQGAASTAGPFPWQRMYITWNSGSSTTANLAIYDQSTVLGGNDFGLDNISFSQLSPAPFTLAAASNTPVCAGNTINLTGTPTGGNYPLTYSWSGPLSYASTNQNPGITNATTSMSGAYNITCTDVYGCTATATTTVLVSNYPVGSATPQTICSGSTTSITLNSTVTGTTFTWTAADFSGTINGESNCSSSCSTIAQTLTSTAGGVERYTITPTVNGCVGSNFTVDVTVNSLPTQLSVTGATTICSGTSANISIANSQVGVNYQLRNNSGNTNVGSPVTGTGGTILLPTGSLSSTTTFNVIGTNATTLCSQQMSNTVTITVNTTPTATVTNSSQSICTGTAFTTMTFGTSPTVTGTTFAWTRDNTSAVTGVAASGSGTSITGVTLTNTTNAPVTVTFTITPTGPSSTFCVGSPTTATIVVNPKPTGSASAQSVCTGSASSVALNSNVSGTTFTWTAALLSGNVSGAAACASSCGTTIAQTLTTTSTGVERYTVTPGYSGCNGSTFTVDVTVNSLPTLLTPTGSATICSGSSANISVPTSQTGVSYQLRNNADNSLVGSAVNGTGGTITLNTGTLNSTTVFNVLATNSTTGCTRQMTGTITITVNTTPTATVTNGAQNICSGSAFTTMVLGTNPTVASTTFAWTRNNTASVTGIASSGSGTSISGATLTNTTSSPVTVTFTITPTGPSPTLCVGSPITATVTVNPLPTLLTPTGTATICSGSSTNISIASSQIGVNYQLRNNSGNANVGSAVAGTGGTITLPTGNLTGTTTFNVLATNASTSCSQQMSGTVTITVNSANTATAGGPNTVCQSSSPAAITLAGASVGGAATQGAWSITSGTGTLSSTAMTASPAAVTFTPSANSNGTVILTLTSNVTGACAVATATRTITVNSLPATTASSNSPICTLTTLNLNAGPQGANSYSWAGPGGYTSSAQNPSRTSPATTASGTYTVTATDANGCSQSASVSVSVYAGVTGQWIGGISSDWNNALNWCGSIPDSTTDVIIPGGTPYSPIVNASAMSRHLNIQSGNSLTIVGGGDFKLYGNLTLGGTYTHNAGVLELVGKFNQSIPGIKADSVVMNNANGVTLSGNLVIKNNLNLKNGLITTGNNLVDVQDSMHHSIISYSEYSYVNGNLRRALGDTGQYSFPVGTSTNYELARINFASLQKKRNGGIDSLTAFFTADNSNCTQVPTSGGPMVNGTEINGFLNGGFWTIHPDTSVYSNIEYTVTLFERGYTNAPNSPTQLAVIKRNDCSSPWQSVGTHNNNTQTIALSTAKAVRSTLTSFSDFGIGFNQDNALPVEMMYIEAEAISNSYIQVRWGTAVEINNKGFEVERSSDGKKWSTIGWVDGHGYSTMQLDYEYNDKTAEPNIRYYYRLKQIDFNTAFKYTGVVTAMLTGNDVFEITDFAPNPTASGTYLQITSSTDMEVRINVYNLLGQRAMELSYEVTKGINNRIDFDFRKLPAGTYTAVVETQKGNYSKKIVIAR